MTAELEPKLKSGDVFFYAGSIVEVINCKEKNTYQVKEILVNVDTLEITEFDFGDDIIKEENPMKVKRSDIVKTACAAELFDDKDQDPLELKRQIIKGVFPLTKTYLGSEITLEKVKPLIELSKSLPFFD